MKSEYLFYLLQPIFLYTFTNKCLLTEIVLATNKHKNLIQFDSISLISTMATLKNQINAAIRCIRAGNLFEVQHFNAELHWGSAPTNTKIILHDFHGK